ncbi:MAG: Spy/CpxP family protein refolding chaperone [Desulforhopalus sp.]|jgi:Spy/CpxP family protein refolding chaperone
MKNKLIAAVATLTIIIGFSALNASAWNNMGPMMDNGHGMMYGSGATDAASQKFLDETKGVRLAIAADQTELAAIVAGPNPDSKRVRELSKNIATNQLALEDKSRGYGYGSGSGRMHENHMRGPGMMNDGHYNGCRW